MAPMPASESYLIKSASRIGFVDLPGRNYRLARGSAYRSAGTDGGALGADIDAIERATGVTLPAPD